MSMLKFGGLATALVLVGLACYQSPAGFAADEKTGAVAPATAESGAGWIGLMLEEESDGGAGVKQVFPGGPAAMAGVRVGDKVVGLNKKKLGSAEELIAIVEKLKPGSHSQITIMRGGKSATLGVVIGSLRQFHENYVSEMMRRDPSDPKSGKFPGVSESDMQAEVYRRLMEQNQRLEQMIQDLHKEVKELRSEVRALKK